jgi:hypothetical protein
MSFRFSDFMSLSSRPRMDETFGARADKPHERQRLVRAALPALGQLQPPATIPHSGQLGKKFPGP